MGSCCGRPCGNDSAAAVDAAATTSSGALSKVSKGPEDENTKELTPKTTNSEESGDEGENESAAVDAAETTSSGTLSKVSKGPERENTKELTRDPTNSEEEKKDEGENKTATKVETEFATEVIAEGAQFPPASTKSEEEIHDERENETATSTNNTKVATEAATEVAAEVAMSPKMIKKREEDKKVPTPQTTNRAKDKQKELPAEEVEEATAKRVAVAAQDVAVHSHATNGNGSRAPTGNAFSNTAGIISQLVFLHANAMISDVEIRDRLLALELKIDGEYFHKTGDVFDIVRVPFMDPDLLERVKNEPSPSFLLRQITSCDTRPIEGSNSKVYMWSTTKAKGDVKRYIDPTGKIFGDNASDVSNMLGTYKKPSLTCLIPDSPFCSMFWIVPVDIIAGPELRSSSPEAMFWKCHGTNNEFHNLGVKNIPQNFMMLPEGHGLHFDGDNAGKCLVLPFPDLCGDGYGENDYNVLVVCKDEADYNWLMAPNKRAKFTDGFCEEASREEIEAAVDYLIENIKILAMLLVDRENGTLSAILKSVFKDILIQPPQYTLDDETNSLSFHGSQESQSSSDEGEVQIFANEKKDEHTVVSATNEMVRNTVAPPYTQDESTVISAPPALTNELVRNPAGPRDAAIDSAAVLPLSNDAAAGSVDSTSVDTKSTNAKAESAVAEVWFLRPDKNPPSFADKENLTDAQKKVLTKYKKWQCMEKEMRENYQKLTKAADILDELGTVRVPQLKGFEGQKVLKVRMGGSYEYLNGEKGRENIPWMRLVGLRAAVNWSVYADSCFVVKDSNGKVKKPPSEQLLVAGGSSEDTLNDSSEDEASFEAENDFILSLLAGQSDGLDAFDESCRLPGALQVPTCISFRPAQISDEDDKLSTNEDEFPSTKSTASPKRVHLIEDDVEFAIGSSLN